MAVLTAAYDDTLSRVTLSASALPSLTDTALFERSPDQIQWSPVRGGAAVVVAAGLASCTDYEFVPGTLNYYRVSAVRLALPSFVAAGAAATANNASVSPAVPAGYAEGDLLVIWASVRNQGAGSVDVPAGWDVMLRTSNIALLGRRATASESAPTVTITGGVANADVIAQMACFRNAELAPASSTYQLNPSAQNIAFPPLSGVQPNWALVLYLGWRQASWTTVDVLPGATEIGKPTATAGSGMGLVWDYRVLATPAAVAAGSFVVTGGTTQISYGALAVLRTADYVTRTVTSITPNMTCVWLKFPVAPYLNQVATLVGWDETSRTTRMGFYTIIGKRVTLTSSDTHVPRTVTIRLFAYSDAEVAALDLVLSVGQIMLLHTPSGIALKSMYTGIGTYTYVKPASLSHRATYSIPLTETAQPDLTISGATVTWATLVTNYPTWAAGLAANATWSAVLALTGAPADILVGM